MFEQQFAITSKGYLLTSCVKNLATFIPYAITIKLVIKRLLLFTIHSPDIQEIALVEMETKTQIKCLEILIQEWQMSASYTLN